MTRSLIRVFGFIAVAMALATWRAPAPQAQIASDPQPAKATLALVGGLLIDGHEGPPLYNSVVLVDGKKIVAVGSADALKVPAGTRIVDVSGYTVMPGLIDRHVHLDLLGHGDYKEWHAWARPRSEQLFAISAKILLNAGVTTAVDFGGIPEVQLKTRDRINKGELIGPRMWVSVGWMCNWTPEFQAQHHRGWYIFNARTVDEARALATKTLDMGADFIKAYGGLSPEQIKVIAEVAHGRGKKVWGHGAGDAGSIALIQAGQDAIEHRANPDSPELVRVLRARRTAVPLTLINQLGPVISVSEDPTYFDNPAYRAQMPPEFWTKMRESLAHWNRLPYFGSAVRIGRMEETIGQVKRLYDAGVRIMLGTDSGAAGSFHADSAWRTMDIMVRAGIPAMEVIGMATRIPAEDMGLSEQIGTIAPGKLADIIVVDGNPLVSMRDLDHVSFVFKEGVQYKGLGTTVRVPAIQGPTTTTASAQ
jgi:imidazolonepropionase-like amidohydrolase